MQPENLHIKLVEENFTGSFIFKSFLFAHLQFGQLEEIPLLGTILS